MSGNWKNVLVIVVVAAICLGLMLGESWLLVAVAAPAVADGFGLEPTTATVWTLFATMVLGWAVRVTVVLVQAYYIRRSIRQVPSTWGRSHGGRRCDLELTCRARQVVGVAYRLPRPSGLRLFTYAEPPWGNGLSPQLVRRSPPDSRFLLGSGATFTRATGGEDGPPPASNAVMYVCLLTRA